jgi:hypothetical protein
MANISNVSIHDFKKNSTIRFSSTRQIEWYKNKLVVVKFELLNLLIKFCNFLCSAKYCGSLPGVS